MFLAWTRQCSIVQIRKVHTRVPNWWLVLLLQFVHEVFKVGLQVADLWLAFSIHYADWWFLLLQTRSHFWCCCSLHGKSLGWFLLHRFFFLYQSDLIDRRLSLVFFLFGIRDVGRIFLNRITVRLVLVDLRTVLGFLPGQIHIGSRRGRETSLQVFAIFRWRFFLRHDFNILLWQFWCQRKRRSTLYWLHVIRRLCMVNWQGYSIYIGWFIYGFLTIILVLVVIIFGIHSFRWWETANQTCFTLLSSGISIISCLIFWMSFQIPGWLSRRINCNSRFLAWLYLQILKFEWIDSKLSLWTIKHEGSAFHFESDHLRVNF